MSSPNHLISNIEDAFSKYILIVQDYSPASPGKTYSSASDDSTDKSKLVNKQIKKMEDEVYNFSVKGNDLKTYVRRFQELAILCPNMVPNNEKLMEVFIGGLPRSIKGNVTTSKPQTLEEAINIA
nr:reverse transcriptase domain-containing protein [Tanacetum cinerariifolium]